MNIDYWEQFYSTKEVVQEHSLFAQFVLEFCGKDKMKLIELGCGNGRDAVFFGENNFKVTAVDQCSTTISELSNRFEEDNNMNFLRADFTNLDKTHEVDIVYSRFTLHSINDEQEDRVTRWAHDVLSKEGYFCIEVRGRKNEIYQLGENVEGDPHAFIYDDHYRRFLDFKKFQGRLEAIGFKIILAKEERGFAPFKEHNRTFIRIIAQK
jgi:tellurite methyltransferase